MTTSAAKLQTASQLFSTNDASLLKKHLQALVQVEFLTIPLYLTAVYSFTDAAVAYQDQSGATPLFDAQQEILSVAVQEMLHLQLACNLCNSFGVTPEIPQLTATADEVIVVPHLEPTAGTPLTTTIGNLPDVIAALLAIEKPATGGFPEPNDKVIYGSIADLYHATLVLLSKYAHAWGHIDPVDDPHFIANHNQVNYGTFSSTYPQIPTIQLQSDVAIVANAITDQGEGGLVAKSAGAPFVSAPTPSVLPQFQPAKGTRFARWGAKSHYTRFFDVKNVINAPQYQGATNSFSLPDGQPIFYYPYDLKSADLPDWAPSAESLQQSAATLWSYAIDLLQANFANGSLNPNSGSSSTGTSATPGFNDSMLSFKYIIPMLWQYGEVINYQYTAGVTGEQAQKAMDSADPLSLFHWDQKTAELRAQWKQAGVELNACQGLNECSGKGWGGIATAKGNGACATADLHTCGGNNDCSSQGGCGFLSTGSNNNLLPAAQQWIPSENVGANTGGCQTPISVNQVFDRTATKTINEQTEWTKPEQDALTAQVGHNVWDHARAVFATQNKITQLPTPLSTQAYDGNARRAAVAATST